MLDQIDAVRNRNDARHHGTGPDDTDPLLSSAGLHRNQAGAQAAREAHIDLLQIAAQKRSYVVRRAGDAIEEDFEIVEIDVAGQIDHPHGRDRVPAAGWNQSFRRVRVRDAADFGA